MGGRWRWDAESAGRRRHKGGVEVELTVGRRGGRVLGGGKLFVSDTHTGAQGTALECRRGSGNGRQKMTASFVTSTNHVAEGSHLTKSIGMLYRRSKN